MDERLLALARRARGFMPDDEGLALHDAALGLTVPGPMVEIGSYCGKSAVYLGAAARAGGRLLFSVDHHRGSEENQAGWEHHDQELVDAITGRMDSLRFFRSTIEAAALEETVVAVVGHSAAIARSWQAPLALLFIDGAHSDEPAMADYQGWAPRLVAGGLLAIHDVFPDPAHGGQGPFHVWERACSEGFEAAGGCGSLRILRRPRGDARPGRGRLD